MMLGGALIVAALVLVPGRVIARAFGLSRDAFTATIVGVGAASVVGMLLARVHAFSLAALLLVLGGLSLAAVIARRGSGEGVTVDPPPVARARRVAAVMAVLAFAWTWPPFETFLAASDSTMYLSAGIHLARHGSLEVKSDAVAVLGRQTTSGIFPSVRVDGRGPFIRLPGGLLMSDVGDDRALPAFFPLLPVWTGIATLAWGPDGAPLVAPLTLALAVWAVTLLAAEAFGAGVGVATGVLLLANFSLWWFGRFLMPELLAGAFAWGGLVFLRRDATATAGLMFGLAGLARAEMMLFLIAAVALWVLWERPRIGLARLAAGFVPLALLTGFSLLGLPSHHVAYLRNDVVLAFARTVRGVPLGTTVAVTAALLGLLALGGFVLSLRSTHLGDRTLRVLTVLAVATVLVIYLIVGGNADPLRSVRWLAAYCSWPLLGLALAGGVAAWRGTDPVVRLTLILGGLVALVFIINPRVAPYHPWAIRRFLPIVIPALTVAAAVAVGVLAQNGRRAGRVAVAFLVIGLVVLEVRPVHAVRGRWFFYDTLRTAETVAEMLPLDAFVVVDSGLADVQLQVPLWLTYERETVMMAGETANWRAALFALVRSGRPVYWIDGRLALPPRVDGLDFERSVPNPELSLLLPNSGIDAPPQLMIGRRYRLKVYRVRLTDA